MLAELYVLTGRDAGKIVDAAVGPTLFLGRAASNHLRIRDPQASRVHCRIDVATDGLTVQDAGSGNGTFVNEDRLEGDPRRLIDGDEIRIGVTRLKILIETEQDKRLWSEGSGLGASSASEVARAERPSESLPALPDPSVATPPAGTARPGAKPGEGPPRKQANILREVIPGYRLLARLGGHSRTGVAVYRALQHSLERQVALKVFLRRGATRQEDVERFLREAKAIARLPHPNTVTIHDVIERGKLKAIVMEFLGGGSLADRIIDGGAMGVVETLRVGESIARALGYLHKHGVRHRGVKPGSILLEPEHNTYKLGAFGLATGPDLQRFGDTSFLDSPVEELAYLAPEQLKDPDAVDARSDVYCLGATLYACAVGTPPFSADSAAGIGASILRDDPAPLDGHEVDVPPALQAIVERCMSKDPAARYPSGEELLEELRACGAPGAESQG